MNKRLNRLKPYPFERLNALLADVSPPADLSPVLLSLGEPKHAAAQFLIDQYKNEESIRAGLGAYPPTKGIPALREAIADFLTRRYDLPEGINPETQVLPVNGTREALFAVAQALVDPTEGGSILMPNPFYQIYEGAALLAGCEPKYLACTAETDFLPDLTAVTDDEWQACRMIYICSPGNPTGAVMPMPQLKTLVEKAQQHDFIIGSDECYSEIYDLTPPPGLLGAATMAGVTDFKNCLVVNSLSKRSNLPGLRSGLVAGDADLIKDFLLYRTYHGSAMAVHNQMLSVCAWADESHVEENRALYRQKFDVFLDVLANVWPMQRPAAGFYLWPETPVSDEQFTQELMATQHVKVIPGSYLSRDSNGINPGANRVRMALVATVEECTLAAERLHAFITSR